MSSAENATLPRDRSSRPRVLVVDDTALNLKLMAAVLGTLDCEVELATSGKEALSLLEGLEFAVLLLDVQMPDLDGYEVARRVRARPETQDLPIIFLTAAKLDDGHVLRGYGSGAVDFLFKPIDQTILRSKVRVFLELYASQRQTADAKSNLERAYHELESTQAQLVHSAKMASLGELVAGIAHEINNPLAFALSHLETAKKCLARAHASWGLPAAEAATADWDRALSRLTETSVGLERIRDLIIKLRIFSRLDEGERKLASVRECVESVVMILRHRLLDRIEIEMSFGEPDEIECYPSLLNQALLNILANAIDAIDGPGSVRVSTGAAASDYVITISDTGPGIPPDLRTRVLEPFFTTKPVGQGTGLGLSISHSIAQKHGGTLTLECPEGGGTTATIRLPLTTPAG